MKVLNKSNNPWKTQATNRNQNEYCQENIYAKAIGIKQKKESLKNKTLLQKKAIVSGQEAQQKYGWESSHSGNSDKTDEQSGKKTLSRFNSKSGTTNNVFENTAASSSFVERASYSNPYVAAAQTAKKIIDKGKEYVSSTLQREKQESEQMKDKGTKKNPITRFLLVGAVSVFAFSMLIGTAFIPLLAIGGVTAGGADYFSTRDTTIVTVAQFEEANADDNIGGEKYKTWYGIDGDWCAMFVSWCADQCGYIDYGLMPKTASVANMATWYQNMELWQSQESGYEPQPGDIIFFQEKMSHVGIVVAYDAERKIVYTVEGNTGASATSIYHKGSRVQGKAYPLSYPKITGYGIPQYPTSFFGALEN